MADEIIKVKIIPRWLMIILAIFLINLMAVSIFYALYGFKYQNRFYPNIYLADVNVGGLDINEAKNILNNRVDGIILNGITFNFEDKTTNIQPFVSSAEGDIAYQIINFDLDKKITQAFAYGRSQSNIINFAERLKLLAKRKVFLMQPYINYDTIKNLLTQNFSAYETPAQDAKLQYLTKSDNQEFSVTEEKTGTKINYNQGLSEMYGKISLLANPPVNLLAENDSPKISKKDALNINQKGQRILSLAPLLLQAREKQFPIDKIQLAGLLGLVRNQDENSSDLILVGIDEAAAINFLEQTLAPKINLEPTLSKFEIKNGKVGVFQVGQDGFKLDPLASFNNIAQAISLGTSTVNLVVNDIKSESQYGDADKFGIKEIVGSGESNFKGSPKNRRHNIKNGADTLNGVLIKPAEEFSLVKTLGDISSSSGYLPELVIKGNKTTPEYGGGLCQIGTTMFRAALGSGLPITMRRNHSYRVVYYEPAGTDATIYDPLPDLRFINDTGSHILIQSRIEGDKLYFDFWGTADGRIATRTIPTIYNIVKPGPTKIVETLDLKPGEKKCTEVAHNGADAYFDYKVTYSDGQTKEKRFSSHYIPWRAVCLLGVEKLSAENPPADTKNPPAVQTNQLKN